MHWQVIVALVVMIPVILIPVAILWYINATSIFQTAFKFLRKRSTKQTEAALRHQESGSEDYAKYPVP
jgi:hypothetical protein